MLYISREILLGASHAGSGYLTAYYITDDYRETFSRLANCAVQEKNILYLIDWPPPLCIQIEFNRII